MVSFDFKTLSKFCPYGVTSAHARENNAHIPGAILEISLRLGVIPLSATTQRVFLTNFLTLYT